MTRFLQITGALLALLALAVALAACGGGVPGNAVAKVGDADITKTDFERALAATAKSSAQVPGQKAVVPDPPSFTKCAKAKAKSQPRSSTQPKQADKVYVKQCREEYDALKEQTMSQLIQGEWLRGEAKEQGIEASDKEVKKRFEEQKKASFPKEKDFQKFLKSSGLTLGDILDRVELDVLATKLRNKVTKGKDKVSEKQVAAYYDKNQGQFATPERRDIRMVMTRGKAKAQEALKAIRGGQKFAAVAKRYSTDPQTKSSGGLLRGAVKGQQDVKLDEAAFSAPKGRLEGPVKGQFGWYVFRVEKITPKSQRKLDDVKSSIRAQLIAKNQQKALSDFIKDFRKRWTDKTDCRKGYRVQGCKNGPKKPKNPAPAQPPPGG